MANNQKSPKPVNKKAASNKPGKHKSNKTKSSGQKQLGPRGIAAQVLDAVHSQGQSLSTALPHFSQLLSDSEQPLLHELCYGSLRWFFRLQAVVDSLLQKPLRAKDRIVYYLLLIGLYQLVYLKKPDYAVVQETVGELGKLKRIWAKGLVNALLRRFLREQEQLLEQVDQDLAQRFAHPEWLLKHLVNDWQALFDSQEYQLEDVLAGNNQHPPFWLRVNRRQTNLADYQDKLIAEDINHHILSESYDALCLNQAQKVETIPGFGQGMVSVQDAAAQFAAHLLSASSGDRVLDVCAAPGGKTAHILENQTEIKHLLALDISATRLQQVQENLDRIGLTATLKAVDALELEAWWDGELFERVLLDAPCSATGVIRRHPDIKVLRRAEDITALVALQQQILEKIWTVVKPGGILLYATCSILRNENDRQVTRFLKSHPDASEEKIVLPHGRAMSPGWQILPGEGQADGFYYAKITKKA